MPARANRSARLKKGNPARPGTSGCPEFGVAARPCPGKRADRLSKSVSGGRRGLTTESRWSNGPKDHGGERKYAVDRREPVPTGFGIGALGYSLSRVAQACRMSAVRCYLSAQVWRQ